MAERPPLPRDIEAVLDRCVGEMRERLVGELERAETEADKLEILARFRREIGDVRGKVSERAGISIGQKWALVGAGLAVFGVGAVTASLWPRSQAAGTAAVEAPKGDDVAVGAGEPLPKPAPDQTEISVPGGPGGGATATKREEGAKRDAARTTRIIEGLSSGVEQDLHVKNRFFPKFIKALKSKEIDKAELAKIKAKLQAASVPKELLDAIEKANGALAPALIKQLQDLGVDTKSFATDTGSSEPSESESSKLTPEKAQERFTLLKQYVKSLNGLQDTASIEASLKDKFGLDAGLLIDMKKPEWDTSIFDRLGALGIDYRDLIQ